MEIKPLIHTSPDVLFDAWQDAFEEYERSWNKAELEKMLHRRGYTPHLSFGAFDNGRLVSFTLNGIGHYDNLKTAYDTGTGTIQQYRGQGLAAAIFNHSVPYLQKEGIAQYLLEVLQHNTKAITIYTHMGFSTTRKFDYFVQQQDAVQIQTPVLPHGYTVQETAINMELMAAMYDFVPAWQNSFDALCRKIDSFKIIGAFHGETLAGYGIIEPETGDIPLLAVDKAHRNKTIGTALLSELLKHNRHTSVKIINTETGNNGLAGFLEKHGIPKRGMQYEMVKKLT